MFKALMFPPLKKEKENPRILQTKETKDDIYYSLLKNTTQD
jgi:hypothetical protein